MIVVDIVGVVVDYDVDYCGFVVLVRYLYPVSGPYEGRSEEIPLVVI